MKLFEIRMKKKIMPKFFMDAFNLNYYQLKLINKISLITIYLLISKHTCIYIPVRIQPFGNVHNRMVT